MVWQYYDEIFIQFLQLCIYKNQFETFPQFVAVLLQTGEPLVIFMHLLYIAKLTGPFFWRGFIHRPVNFVYIPTTL